MNKADRKAFEAEVLKIDNERLKARVARLEELLRIAREYHEDGINWDGDDCDEVDAVLEDARRKEAMPDERSAIKAFFDAWLRLQDFGWKEAIYCPKDGSVFDIIEPGSTGIHKCHYQGDWPKGAWLVHGDYDLWPSHPALFRPIKKPEINE